MTHTIRLHGPWQYSAVDVAAQNKSGTIQIPADWGGTLGGDFRGRVRYTRRFGKPTGLNKDDRVDLVLECVDPAGEAMLNETALGKIEPGLAAARFDITQLLLTRNELVVDVEMPSTEIIRNRFGRDGLPGGIIGEVRLEIFVGT